MKCLVLNLRARSTEHLGRYFAPKILPQRDRMGFRCRQANLCAGEKKIAPTATTTEQHTQKINTHHQQRRQTFAWTLGIIYLLSDSPVFPAKKEINSHKATKPCNNNNTNNNNNNNNMNGNQPPTDGEENRPANHQPFGDGAAIGDNSSGAVGTLAVAAMADLSPSEQVVKLIELLLQMLFGHRKKQQNAPKITEDDDLETSKTVQEIINILKWYPAMALKSFYLSFDYPINLDPLSGESDYDLCVTPIQTCLAAGVSMEKLIELHDINPKMIGCQKVNFRHPGNLQLLHFACSKTNQSAVDSDGIILLANRWPELVSQKSWEHCDGEYPLHKAVKERADTLSLEAVTALFDLFPGVMAPNEMNEYEWETDTMQQAIRSGCRLEVIRFLVGKFHKDVKKLYFDTGDLPVGAAREFCKLLPQLEELTLITKWTPESIKCFLTHLESNSSIIYLSFRLSYQMILEDPKLILLLQEFCKNSPALKTLRLAGSFSVAPNCAPLLEAISTALSCNPTLPTLSVDDVAIPDIHWLVDYLLGGNAPSKIELKRLTLLDTTVEPMKDEGRSHCDGTSSKITHLTIKMPPSSWTVDCFNYLLSYLSNIPRLGLLDVDTLNFGPVTGIGFTTRVPFPDISDSVVNFIGDARHLLSLNLEGFTVDHERLCQSLEQNTCLKELSVPYPYMRSDRKPEKFYEELLKSHNATLEKLKYHMENPDIMYLLKLNQLGRAKMRSPKISRGRFISMMVDALPQYQKTRYLRDRFGAPVPVVNESEYHSLLYDLLRESPGIWCGLKVASRKRKHSDAERPPKYWANVLVSNEGPITNKPAILKGQLNWFTQHGVSQCVIGQIALQRFDKRTPLFRITYNGTYQPGSLHQNAAHGFLVFPPNAPEVELESGWEDRKAWVQMTFPRNEENLDTIKIFWDQTEEDAGRLFTKALDSAHQERRRYYLMEEDDGNMTERQQVGQQQPGLPDIRPRVLDDRKPAAVDKENGTQHGAGSSGRNSNNTF